MEPEALEQQLQQFTGSTQYARLFANLLLTDGVVFLADHAKCWWLLDVYASYLLHIDGNKEPFTCMKLTKDQQSATVVITDGNDKQIAKQLINYTDFPLASMTLYGCWTDDNWVVMLTSEY